MKGFRLFLGASAAAIAVPVLAQDASDEGGIGEIVVTARRRRESIHPKRACSPTL